MTEHAYDISTLLCPACSVLHSAALCERCRSLVASGKNRGPLPSFLIPHALDKHECWACKPPDPAKNPDPSQAKFCSRHIEASTRRRRVVPLEYDRPQTPRAVGQPSSRHWFP
jgi:hypothetical protein